MASHAEDSNSDLHPRARQVVQTSHRAIRTVLISGIPLHVVSMTTQEAGLPKQGRGVILEQCFHQGAVAKSQTPAKPFAEAVDVRSVVKVESGGNPVDERLHDVGACDSKGRRCPYGNEYAPRLVHVWTAHHGNTRHFGRIPHRCRTLGNTSR